MILYDKHWTEKYQKNSGISLGWLIFTFKIQKSALTKNPAVIKNKIDN